MQVIPAKSLANSYLIKDDIMIDTNEFIKYNISINTLKKNQIMSISNLNVNKESPSLNTHKDYNEINSELLISDNTISDSVLKYDSKEKINEKQNLPSNNNYTNKEYDLNDTNNFLLDNKSRLIGNINETQISLLKTAKDQDNELTQDHIINEILIHENNDLLAKLNIKNIINIGDETKFFF